MVPGTSTGRTSTVSRLLKSIDLTPSLSCCVVNNQRRLIIGAVLVGVLLIAVAIIYFTTPEHSLPSFFPGHTSASSAEANHHHTKHGIAALVVALACFAFAWFQSGPKTPSAGSQT